MKDWLCGYRAETWTQRSSSSYRTKGYLTNLALKHSEWCDLDDLKQEGALALLEAAKRFDPAHGTKLLTYATPAVVSAMMDYASRGSLAIHIPFSRYHQLCRVAHVFAEAEDGSESVLVDAVCEKIGGISKGGRGADPGIPDAVLCPAVRR